MLRAPTLQLVRVVVGRPFKKRASNPLSRRAWAFLLKSDRRLNVGHYQWMRSLSCRGELRDEQRSDEKSMIRQLNDSCLPVLVAADDAQPTVMDKPLIGGVETKVTVVLFLHGALLVEAKDTRLGVELNIHRLPDQGTAQGGNE
jgi:hypothetical protein